MRYDFSKMDTDSFELMVRSLNERMFGIRCSQYGTGPDGQREFTFEGTVKDQAGVVFEGRTFGQVKYKYITSKEDDYKWLVKEIDSELRRFREKETDYIPDNFLFYTNVVLTPVKDTGVKDKIEAYVKEHNDIIGHFYVRGYDEICAMLDNNRDVAVSYAATILSGDLLVKMLEREEINCIPILKKYLFGEFEEEMYPRLEQAGSMEEKRIPIEKVCIDIDVTSRQGRTVKFAKHVFSLGNEILGYKEAGGSDELCIDKNFVLVGGPGKGKSTISQFIAQIYRAYDLKALGYRDKTVEKFLKEFNKSYGYRIDRVRIPFKVALREYAAWMKRKGEDEVVSVLQYMRERIGRFEGNVLAADVLRKMLKEQSWIFFFDGLDEVPESSNRQEVLAQIRMFLAMELREAQCDCMVIGTTREEGYNNDFDEEKYTHMEVAELSREDSQIYIGKLFVAMEEQAERREEYIRIMYEALEDEITSRLMKTPLQITIIAILVKSGGKPPHERYSLFRQYYDTIVKREKQKNVVATLNDNTGWLEELHYLIGHRLQRESEKAENASAEISTDELWKLISNYIEEKRDDYYEAETEEKENAFLMTITQRICFLNENKEGLYSFTIRSMQEYFAGTYLVKDKRDGDAMCNIERIAYTSYWRNALLFALGYIELERKSLEPEIGLLCERMNGKDNILQEDYTSDNLCLFGSWLAVDILAEDIFRGKRQDKYIELAARVAGFDKCTDYRKFSAVSGAQKDKLVSYVKERCSGNPEQVIEAVKLYLKLSENRKNDLNNEVADTIKMLTEEQVLAFDIDIVANGMKSGKKVLNASVCRIKEGLEKGQIKQFLPARVLERLLVLIDSAPGIDLKKNMLLQCLYEKNGFDRLGELIELKNWLGFQCDMEKLFMYLSPMYREWYRYGNTKVNLSECVEIACHDREIDETALLAIQEELRALNLEYLAELGGFLLNPTLSGYQELCEKLNKEEVYLAKQYRRVLKYYVRREKFDSEEQFRQIQAERKKDCNSLMKGDFDAVCYKDTDIEFSYSYGYFEYVFDDLMKNGKIHMDNLELLSDVFFYIYPSVAEAQMNIKGSLSDDDTELADGLVRIISETNRRGKYRYRENVLVAVLAGSKFKGNLWKQVPDFLLVDEMLKLELRKDRYRGYLVQTETLQKAIGNIIGKIIYDSKESNYLAIIPTLVNQPIDITKCVSENEIQELEQITYCVGANLLTMRLLKMCMDKNERPGKVLDSFLECDVLRNIVYKEIEIILRYCPVQNKEKLWVETYLRLEKEDFEESGQICQRIMDDMMEMKCNAAG